LKLSLIAVLFFLPHPAHAVLGGSVERRILKTSEPLYSVHRIESDAVVVKEYVSQQGVVFAITWSGTRHPEIEPLLGKYESEFKFIEASQPPVKGMRSRTLHSPHLLVQSWGHPRHLEGRIADPGLIPEGVNLYDLR